MIKLTIDGNEVEAEEGMTVLSSAQSANIYIPTLCSHSNLTPYGGCRLCIVEIEGVKGFPTACTMPAEDGMIIRTATPQLQELRRRILELILSEHPYTCLVCEKKNICEEYQQSTRKVGVTTGCEFCPKNHQCELQKVVEKIGLKDVLFPMTYRALPVENTDPFYDRDYNLCILCGRCVRVCQLRHRGNHSVFGEASGTGVLSFIYRGTRALVGTAFGKSHIESDCEFCGACVDVCPTCALSEKINKWEGITERSVETICPYCGVGCTIKLNIRGNRVISATHSSGQLDVAPLCVRGRFCVVEMVHSPNRLKTPLIRRNDKFVEASWDEALNVLTESLSKYKGKEFAFISSPQCTNEDNYIFQKFTRIAMDSNNIAVISNEKEPCECNIVGAYNIIGKTDYVKILKAISNGKIKALYLTGDIVGGNNLRLLKKLDFLAVQSVFSVPAMESAHIVLPVASFAEIDGSFINASGTVQHLHKAIEPLHNSRPDWWVLCEIAKRLGVSGFDFKNYQEISSEMHQYEVAPLIERLTRTETRKHPPEIKPSDGFYSYRGGSLIDEVRGLSEVVEHWKKLKK